MIKEVNISHIGSEEDIEEIERPPSSDLPPLPDDRPEIFRKKAFLDQFYPPSNKQESISID